MNRRQFFLAALGAAVPAAPVGVALAPATPAPARYTLMMGEAEPHLDRDGRTRWRVKLTFEPAAPTAPGLTADEIVARYHSLVPPRGCRCDDKYIEATATRAVIAAEFVEFDANPRV